MSDGTFLPTAALGWILVLLLPAGAALSIVERTRWGAVIAGVALMRPAEFHRLAPKVALAPGLQGLTNYFFGGVRPSSMRLTA